jgi:hypothetical protein
VLREAAIRVARFSTCAAPDATRGSRQQQPEIRMRGLVRTLLAGYGAKKLGGGCHSTIIIFLILYWLLGHLL